MNIDFYNEKIFGSCQNNMSHLVRLLGSMLLVSPICFWFLRFKSVLRHIIEQTWPFNNNWQFGEINFQFYYLVYQRPIQWNLNLIINNHIFSLKHFKEIFTSFENLTLTCYIEDIIPKSFQLDKILILHLMMSSNGCKPRRGVDLRWTSSVL